jgi:hypothetical protein
LVVELVPGSLWFISREKNVRMAMELEVSERFVFRPTIFVVMILKGFAVERQKRFSSYECLGTMAEKCCFNTFLIISFEQSFSYVRGTKGRTRGEGQT